MKISIIIISVLTVFSTFAIAHFEHQGKKRKVFISAGLTGFLTLITIIFQQIQQNNDADEIARINTQLIENSKQTIDYATGGGNNKPYIQISFHKELDSSFSAFFVVANFGEYPFSNFSYDITDFHSLQYSFLKENNLNFSTRTESQIQATERYLSEHQKETSQTGTKPLTPKGFGQLFYTGRLHKEISQADYNIRVWWNNQYYDLKISYARDKFDNFSLYQFIVWSSDKKTHTSLSDLKRFFPTVPSEQWKTLPQMKDSLNGIYEFDYHRYAK